MKIATAGIKLSCMLMDNVSLGVKFSSALGNVNVLLVTTKKTTRLQHTVKAGEGAKRGLKVSDRLSVFRSRKVTVCDFMWHPGV